MTAKTYSLAVTGVLSHQPFATAQVTISDENARTGSMIQNVRLGTQFLCRRLDGSEAYYRFDAERSTPANPVLIRV
jgi:hypothetical protein